MKQARLVADRLREIRFDTVHSSDLQRCLSTAEIIAGPGGPRPRPDSRLREIDTGLWQGFTFEEAASQYPREYAEREHDLVGYHFPGGESFRDLRERAVQAFLEIVEESCGNALVVAHRGVNRVLLCEVLGLPLEELFSIGQDYGAVTLIRTSMLFDGGRRMEVVASPTVAP